jgi:acyl carrier protein
VSNPQAQIEAVLHDFLARNDKDISFDLGTSLYADGLSLDSLETAELSALLEDEFGRDPFSDETMPRTVGDLVRYYSAAA